MRLHKKLESVLWQILGIHNFFEQFLLQTYWQKSCSKVGDKAFWRQILLNYMIWLTWTKKGVQTCPCLGYGVEQIEMHMEWGIMDKNIMLLYMQEGLRIIASECVLIQVNMSTQFQVKWNSHLLGCVWHFFIMIRSSMSSKVYTVCYAKRNHVVFHLPTPLSRRKV